jgi:cytidylate kinase
MAGKINIAIDGHTGSGKSTIAKDLASELGYLFIDTGAMYRAMSLYAIREDLFENGELQKGLLIDCLDVVHIDFDYNPQEKKYCVRLNGVEVEKEIRGMEVSNVVSQVAKVPEVRQKLVALQRHLGQSKGVVMDGRDIGTVVFPDAELKIFVTTSAEERANRRFQELQEKGQDVKFEDVLANILARDKMDTEREHSPLQQAADAKVLDNQQMTRQEQLQVALSWAREILN